MQTFNTQLSLEINTKKHTQKQFFRQIPLRGSIFFRWYAHKKRIIKHIETTLSFHLHTWSLKFTKTCANMIGSHPIVVYIWNADYVRLIMTVTINEFLLRIFLLCFISLKPVQTPPIKSNISIRKIQSNRVLSGNANPFVSLLFSLTLFLSASLNLSLYIIFFNLKLSFSQFYSIFLCIFLSLCLTSKLWFFKSRWILCSIRQIE